MINIFSRPQPEAVAAIDLGSNSFHMIVCRLQNGQLTTHDRLREMVRLRAGLDCEGNITDEAMQRALHCLARFNQRIGHMPNGSVRIIGTKTLRTARNADIFLKQAQQVMGHPIEIISGIEEARLIYLGVAHGLSHDPPRNRLVIDIGGGSTEFIIASGYTPDKLESKGMGCVSMSQKFFPDGEITRKAIRSASVRVLRALEPVEHQYQKNNWEEAIGTSGTIKAIAKIVNKAGWCDEGISDTALKHLIEYMLTIGNMKKFDLPGLSQERIDVFAGGVMILAVAFEALGITHMKVSDYSLREGIIYDMIGRFQHNDARSYSIDQLATRFGTDRDHAYRVHDTLEKMLDSISDNNWLPGQNEIQITLWAALIHEIGLGVAHSQYHKHGAYIAENCDLAGFSRQEQALLARLLRCHRGKPGNSAFDCYSESARLRNAAILLRLAILLHRSHAPVTLPDITLTTGMNSLSMQFPEGFLDQNPLSHADLKAESKILNKIKFRLQIL